MTSESVRQPQQHRSRQTLQRVVDAGIGLLAEGGYEALSIAEVSARAEVSVGSIYARFPSKEALFVLLQERMLEGIDAKQAALFAGLPVLADDTAVVERAVRRLAAHFDDNAPAIRVMVVRGASDTETRERGSRSSHGLAKAWAAHLLQAVHQFGHDEPELAVEMSFRLLYAAFTRRLISGPGFEAPGDIGWPRFVDELVRVTSAYLLAPAPGR